MWQRREQPSRTDLGNSMRRSTAAISGLAGLLLVLVLAASARLAASPVEEPVEPILILVSLDGFRWDYLDLVDTPNLQQLAARGVRAEGLIPVYPSKTFPSHYSIVTGLHPGHHGIISNNMYDSEIDAEFHLHDRDAVEDPRWWGGEPIWVTAEKQGIVAATLFWPGSEAEIAGIRPSYWQPYDESLAFESRVERVLKWLDLPDDDRPRMIALYFEHPNDVSHRYGPEAPETFASIREVDARIGDLVAGIEKRGLSDRVDLVIVSDHGMAEVGPDRVVYVEDYVELEEGEAFELGAILQIYPHEGREDLIYKALHGASPHLAIYRREEIPEHYHLRDHPRTPPILGVPDVGWEVATRSVMQKYRGSMLKGDHGQDPGDPRMHGLFVASGPAIRSGVVIERFEAVEIYNLLTAILGLQPAPNDGDSRHLDEILLTAHSPGGHLNPE